MLLFPLKNPYFDPTFHILQLPDSSVLLHSKRKNVAYFVLPLFLSKSKFYWGIFSCIKILIPSVQLYGFLQMDKLTLCLSQHVNIFITPG